MLLLQRRREGAREELFAHYGEVIHLWLRQSLSLLAILDLVDGDLGAAIRSLLAVGNVTARRRKRYEINRVHVLRAGNKLLLALI